MDITVVILVLVSILLVVGIWYALRWARMRKLGGVNVALRWNPERARAGWHLGVGRYHGEEFTWHRVWSLRSGPDRVFQRDRLRIADRREPVGTESYAVPAGSTVLVCESSDHEPIEIAMGKDALTGFLSWLESAPPGRRVRRAS